MGLFFCISLVKQILYWHYLIGLRHFKTQVARTDKPATYHVVYRGGAAVVNVDPLNTINA